MSQYFQYSEWRDQRKWDKLSDEASLKRMCHILEPRPGDLVCDAATGMGSAAMAIAPRVGRVIAVDVVAARRDSLMRANLPNVEFICADLNRTDLPCEPGSVDIVICRAALHHLDNKKRFFEDAFRVLRPEGRLYVMDPVMSQELRLSWSIISRIAERDYRDYCTLDELLSGVKGAGFEIRYRGEFLFPRSLRDWINSKICLVDSDGKEIQNEYITYVRESLWNIVHTLLPRQMQLELHLDATSDDGWFAYNCVEIVAQKGDRP